MSETVNKMLVDALAFTGYEVSFNTYIGTSPTYFVFLVNSVPTYFTDDEVMYVINNVDLHFYCPITMNTTELRKNVKKALQSAGFTYPIETDVSDERSQHFLYEFEIEEYVE